MSKPLPADKAAAARTLAVMVCDWRGHSHLPFNSCCVESLAHAEGFIRGLIRKKLI